MHHVPWSHDLDCLQMLQTQDVVQWKKYDYPPHSIYKYLTTTQVLIDCSLWLKEIYTWDNTNLSIKVELSGSPDPVFSFADWQVNKPKSVLIDWCLLWEMTSNYASFTTQKISEMVRTRATASGTNNPWHEVGGPSHQNAAEMEARIAQMSRDIEFLT